MSVFADIYDFYSDYKGEKGIIGRSFFGLPIFYAAVEKTERPKIIFQYAIHGREYITSYLCLKQIEDFVSFGKRGKAYFIPLVNSDGVAIACGGSPLYKANGRGVDLNVNFDARWGTGAKNRRTRGEENFIGAYPFSEPESIALRDFTLKVMPDATVSYHAKGEEIYWEFFQEGRLRKINLKLAKAVAEVTGYTIKSTPDSAGGYKDWCADKLKIPSLTVEVGADSLEHPIGVERLDEIYLKNRGVVNEVVNALTEKRWINL